MNNNERRTALISVWRNIFNRELEVKITDGAFEQGGFSFLNYSIDAKNNEWESSVLIGEDVVEIESSSNFWQIIHRIMNDYAGNLIDNACADLELFESLKS